MKYVLGDYTLNYRRKDGIDHPYNQGRVCSKAVLSNTSTFTVWACGINHKRIHVWLQRKSEAFSFDFFLFFYCQLKRECAEQKILDKPEAPELQQFRVCLQIIFYNLWMSETVEILNCSSPYEYVEQKCFFQVLFRTFLYRISDFLIYSHNLKYLWIFFIWMIAFCTGIAVSDYELEWEMTSGMGVLSGWERQTPV